MSKFKDWDEPPHPWPDELTMILKPSVHLEKVRARQPLVHHITNWVTISDCASIVKSLGASPVMAHAPEEVADMSALSSAVVLNIGTLTRELVEAMKMAAAAAGQKRIPVVLDACGAGATRLRDDKCLEILDSCPIPILKGNASEIARLAGVSVRTRGVDATEVSQDMVQIARALAVYRNCTVIVTGKEDIVADAHRAWRVKNGHPMMACVVGTGCMAASVVGAFAAVEPDLLMASLSGLICFEVAAEHAARVSEGPGSFKTRLFDAIYQLAGPAVDGEQRAEPIT